MKKRIAFTLLAAAAQMTLAFPHPDGDSFGDHQPPSVEERVAHLRDRLALSDEQARQVTAIMTRIDKERESMKGKFESLQDQERKEIEAVLSDDQKAKLAEQRPPRPPHF